MMKIFGRFGFSCKLGSKGDRLWYLMSTQGPKVTYLLSCHVATHAEFPDTRVLHLIIGPLRVIIAYINRAESHEDTAQPQNSL